MSLNFLREGKIFIVHDGGALEVTKGLSSYSASQTFLEYRYNRGTINSPKFIDDSGIDALSKASFSLKVYLCPELLNLFELLGFEKDSSNSYSLTNHDNLDFCDIYIEYPNGNKISLNNAVFTSCTIGLGRSLVSMDIEGSCGTIGYESKPTNLNYILTSNPYFGPLEQTISSTGVLNATVTIMREVYWLNSRVMTDELYHPSKAVIQSYDLSANLNLYIRDGFDFTAYTDDVLLAVNDFSIYLPSGFTTERLDLSSPILIKSFDIRQNSTNLELTTITG